MQISEIEFWYPYSAWPFSIANKVTTIAWQPRAEKVPEKVHGPYIARTWGSDNKFFLYFVTLHAQDKHIKWDTQLALAFTPSFTFVGADLKLHTVNVVY